MGWNGPRASGWNSGLRTTGLAGGKMSAMEPGGMESGFMEIPSFVLLPSAAEQKGQVENDVKSPLLRNESK